MVTHNRDKPPEECEGFSVWFKVLVSGGFLDLRGPGESSRFRLLHSHKTLQSFMIKMGLIMEMQHQCFSSISDHQKSHDYSNITKLTHKNIQQTG